MDRSTDQPAAAGRGASGPAASADWLRRAAFGGALRNHARRLALVLLVAQVVIPAGAADAGRFYARKAIWGETLRSARGAWKAAALPEAERATNLVNLGEAIKADFPVPWDWALQDSRGRFAAKRQRMEALERRNLQAWLAPRK